MMTRLQLETRQHALISDSRDNEIYELGVRHGLELASLKRCPTHGTEHTGECPKCADKTPMIGPWLDHYSSLPPFKRKDIDQALLAEWKRRAA